MKRDARYAACLLIAASFLLFFALNRSAFLGNLLDPDNRSQIPAPDRAAVMSASTFPGYPVDLNSAAVEDLMTLPGVGEKTARRIIAERELRGGFSSVEDLLKIKHFGEAGLKRLNNLVTVKRPLENE